MFKAVNPSYVPISRIRLGFVSFTIESRWTSSCRSRDQPTVRASAFLTTTLQASIPGKRSLSDERCSRPLLQALIRCWHSRSLREAAHGNQRRIRTKLKPGLRSPLRRFFLLIIYCKLTNDVPVCRDVDQYAHSDYLWWGF